MKAVNQELLMEIERQIPLLEEILGRWERKLGDNYQGYKNHVYRMVHFCFALRSSSEEERKKIVVAACFHDIGIWTDDTLDYLPPSIALATDYLRQNQLDPWIHEIELMIDMHHKITNYADDRYPLVEVFRRGDLVDFSLGAVPSGLPRSYIKSVKEQFSNAGFHKGLLRVAGRWVSKHPFNPAPIFKW